MHRLIAHVRGNVVGYLALFIALGGTSYAAVILPAGSVGSRQLRASAVGTSKLANGAVTPAKLNAASIGGSIREWASIRQDGSIAGGSRGVFAHVKANQFTVGWGTTFSSRCAVITTPASVGITPAASSIGVNVNEPSSSKGKTSVYVWTYSNGTPTPAPFYIAVIC